MRACCWRLPFINTWLKNHSKNQFSKHDNDSYREKLVLIGISDSGIWESAYKFQKIRNQLIHEKSYMDKGEIKLVQSEADSAYKIVEYVSKTITLQG